MNNTLKSSFKITDSTVHSSKLITSNNYSSYHFIDMDIFADIEVDNIKAQLTLQP